MVICDMPRCMYCRVEVVSGMSPVALWHPECRGLMEERYAGGKCTACGRGDSVEHGNYCGDCDAVGRTGSVPRHVGYPPGGG